MTTGARVFSPPVSSKLAKRTNPRSWRREKFPTFIERYAMAPRPASTKRPTTKSRTGERLIRSHSPQGGDEVVEDQHRDRSNHHRRGGCGADPGRGWLRGVAAVGGDQADDDPEDER